MAHPFPLIRGGGILLICVGVGFLLGWLKPTYWLSFAITGFVSGFIGSSFGSLLDPPLGIPTRFQITALIAAIIFEIALIMYVSRRFQHDERRLILGILLIVGAHFVIMTLSHGPTIGLLGLLTMGNALLGLFVFPNVNIETFGVIDAILKIVFGFWMLLLFPQWQIF